MIAVLIGCGGYNAHKGRKPDRFDQLGKEKSVDSLIAIFKDANVNPVFRRRAAEELGHLKDPRALEPLIAALDDRELYIRSAAMSALSDLQDLRAIGPLIASPKGPNSNLDRDEASRALAKMGPSVVEPLIAILTTGLKDRDSKSVIGAAAGLGRIQDPRAMKPLLSVFREATGDEGGQGARVEAGKALMTIEHPTSVPNYQALVTNRDVLDGQQPDTEAVLIVALWKFGNRDMAQYFLDHGNKTLSEAGVAWAFSNGYYIDPFSHKKPAPGSDQ